MFVLDNLSKPTKAHHVVSIWLIIVKGKRQIVMYRYSCWTLPKGIARVCKHSHGSLASSTHANMLQKHPAIDGRFKLYSQIFEAPLVVSFQIC